MWTTISSYIWGEADEQIVPGCSVDDTQSDDDWILVDLLENKISGKKASCFQCQILQICNRISPAGSTRPQREQFFLWYIEIDSGNRSMN